MTDAELAIWGWLPCEFEPDECERCGEVRALYARSCDPFSADCDYSCMECAAKEAAGNIDWIGRGHRPVTDVLPDCMMPDGADPCAGYKQILARAEAAEAKVAQLREVLIAYDVYREDGGWLCSYFLNRALEVVSAGRDGPMTE